MADESGMDPTPPTPRPRLAGLNPDDLLARGLASPAPAGPPVVPGVEILRPLGRGGMGEVFLGRQEGLDRLVAVKRVAPGFASDPLHAERLQREARLMAGLRHPHLVVLHQLVPLPDGGVALVMEYVEGGTLRDRLLAAPNGLPPAQALRWAREIGSALAAAHAAGVVHRDLKPENVLIDPSGAARVTDFGLARSVSEPSARLTLTGLAVGTADYMAPEQFSGAEPDVRTDVYALGALLYEMLTGVPPRGNFDPPRARGRAVSVPLNDAVLKALRPAPGERFASMAQFLVALERGSGAWNRRSVLIMVAGGLVLMLSLMVPGRSPRPAGPSTPASPAASTPVPELDLHEPWRNLIPGLRLPGAILSGNWQTEGTSLVSDAAVCILALPVALPPAYEVRLAFTRLSGRHSVALFFTANGAVGSVDLDGWEQGLSGVQSLDGRDLRQGGGFPLALENGRRVELEVRVRPDHVQVRVDGVLRSTTSLAGHTLGVVFPWAWNPVEKPAALAIGSYESPTRFDRVEWRPLATPAGDAQK